ncbi:DUF2306 domain-containing protein, partial [Marinitenerispora sediminis]|uniref:DUF2306 domain-containing protein n=1 Tax=Marinitenerispora sediminis TaxID=1931232 RepID=UPI000E087C0A
VGMAHHAVAMTPFTMLAVLWGYPLLERGAGLDPSRSRIPVPDGRPLYYPMLVAHIFLGTVALLTACLQVWPWLRRRHPAVHRWSGRVYVFGGVLPAGVAVLFVAPFGALGPTQQAANTLLAVLWLLTTAAGYRAARQRRFAAHREWMVRSFALSFSIVANRLWMVVCMAVFTPEALTGGSPDPAVFAQALGVSAWLSWVVNLLVAEWWLQRTRSRGRAQRRDARIRRAGGPVPAESARPA